MAFFRNVILYQVLNIVIFIIADNIYDWAGNYFMLMLEGTLIPNLISFVLITGVIAVFSRMKLASNSLRIIGIITSFLMNALAWGLSEHKIILFGLFYHESDPLIIPIDKMHFVLISSTSLVASLIGWMDLRKFSIKKN